MRGLVKEPTGEETRGSSSTDGREIAQWGAEAPPPRRRRRRSLLVNVVVIVATLGFSYIALSHIKLDEAWKALKTIDLWWLIPALGAFALGNVARALRWRSLFPPGRRPPRPTTLNAMMIGYLYNNLLPARAGEAARVMVLNQRSSSPAVEITGTVVLERLFDILGLLAIFFLAAPWLPHVGWFHAAAIVAGVLLAGVLICAGVLAIFGERPLRILLWPLRRFSPLTEERLERALVELVHGLSALRDWRVASEALVWTLAAWMCSVTCAYLIIVAFHLHLGFDAGVLVMVAVGMSMILPSAPAAVGIYEGATLIALNAYKQPHSVALPYAVVLHLVNLIPFVVVGLALLHYNSRHPITTAKRAEPSAAPPAIAPEETDRGAYPEPALPMIAR